MVSTALSPMEEYTWRPAHPGDVAALTRLEFAAGDGSAHRESDRKYEDLFHPAAGMLVRTLCAVRSSGEIAAFSSVVVYSTGQEHRADIDGMVHPRRRGHGNGTFLLTWAEMEARCLLAAMPPDRPSVMRIAFSDRREDAIALYEDRGFRLTFASDTMCRGLHGPFPDHSLSAIVRALPWSEGHASLFHRAYLDAFQTRSGLAAWPEATWRRNLVELPAFRPDLSRVLMARGEEPIGYIICWVGHHENLAVDGQIGQIAQLGIHPGWRNRGLGSCLLAEAVTQFRAVGLDTVALDVDASNRSAQDLYEHFAFRQVGRLNVYTKALQR